MDAGITEGYQPFRELPFHGVEWFQRIISSCKGADLMHLDRNLTASGFSLNLSLSLDCDPESGVVHPRISQQPSKNGDSSQAAQSDETSCVREHSKTDDAAWTIRRIWDVSRRGGVNLSHDHRTFCLRAIRWWEEFEQFNHRRGSPVVEIDEISGVTLLQFYEWICDHAKTDKGRPTTEGRAKDSVKVVVELLNRGEQRLGIIKRAPVFRIDRSERKPLEDTSGHRKFIYTSEEIDRFWTIADAAEWPRKTRDGQSVSAALYWRFFSACGWFYGARSQDVWEYNSEKNRDVDPITHDDMLIDADQSINEQVFTNEHGWIRIRMRKTRRTIYLPMSRIVRALYDEICSQIVVHGERRVCDFPRSNGTRKPNQSYKPSMGFFAQWWHLWELLGVVPPVNGNNQKIHHRPIDFRNTAHTAYRRLIGDDADHVTGHKQMNKSVGATNYYNAIPTLIEAVDQLPQPTEFQKYFRDGTGCLLGD